MMNIKQTLALLLAFALMTAGITAFAGTETGGAVFSLAEHAAIQDMPLGGTFEGASPLQRSGGPVLETVAHPVGGNSIRVSDRVNDWDGVDILLAPAGLNPANTYGITVTGRIVTAPSGSQIMLQGLPGFAWRNNRDVAAGDDFALFLELTPAELSAWDTIRITSNGPGAAMVFVIDDIEIVLAAVGEGAGEAEEADGEENFLYRLSEDAALQALERTATFEAPHFGAVSTFLVNSGDPVFRIVPAEYPGAGNAVFVDERRVGGGNWYGFDILFAPVGVLPGGTYEIRAWGRICPDSPVNAGALEFAQPGEPWGGYAGHTFIRDGDGWTLALRLAGGALNTALANQTGVRISTSPGGAGMNFIVDEIEVVRIGEPETRLRLLHNITFTPQQQGIFGDWFSNTLTHGTSKAEYEWAFSPPGGGADDDYVIRGIHIGTDPAGADGEFTAQRNALRITFPEPLPPGVQYEISVWYFIPSYDGNEGRANFYPPGFLINGMAGTGIYTFIGENAMELDEWVELRASVLYAASYIETLDIRFHGNTAGRYPIAWYFDNISIYESGAVEIALPEWDLTLPSLADAFEPWFMFGNIYPGTTSAVMNQFDTRDMFTHHFNAITAENHHKPDQIAGPGGNFTRPAADEFNFANANPMVDFAIENDIAIIGHALVWHSQSPNWLFLESPGVPLTRQEARGNMEFYIRTVSEHFAARGQLGAFYSWDVVNEVIASGGGIWGPPGTAANTAALLDDWNAGDWRTQIRVESPWYEAYSNNPDPQEGDHPTDFIYDAFVLARRYFPYSLLYYNDYNDEVPAKRNAIAQMVEQLNERWFHDFLNNPEAVPIGQTYTGRLLVEGIGLQAHYHLPMGGWSTNFDNIRPALLRYAHTARAQGVVLSITELDITVGGHGVGARTVAAPLPEYYANWQAEMYARIFGYYLEFADYIERVSLWGLADNQSWRAVGNPLLFDSSFDAKASFFSVLEVAKNAEPRAVAAPVIHTDLLRDGGLNQRYTAWLLAERGSHSPLLWRVTAGSLPPGLNLHSRTGVIEGTPAEAGTFTFTIDASNAGGSYTREFVIAISNE